EQQYEQLKSQVRQARNTPQGMMVKEYRKAQREGTDLVEESLEEFEEELESLEDLRNFIRDFRDKKITIKEFLRGPSYSEQDMPETVEDIIDELAKLGVHIHFNS
ncbi:MAG: molecular chaperone DnaJ, partial [Phormidium sp. GEM2.Bin31]